MVSSAVLERASGGRLTTSRDRSIAGYYPECNVLIPLWHYAEGSKVPAAKSVPVRLFKDVVPEIIEGGEAPISAS